MVLEPQSSSAVGSLPSRISQEVIEEEDASIRRRSRSGGGAEPGDVQAASQPVLSPAVSFSRGFPEARTARDCVELSTQPGEPCSTSGLQPAGPLHMQPNASFAQSSKGAARAPGAAPGGRWPPLGGLEAQRKLAVAGVRSWLRVLPDGSSSVVQLTRAQLSLDLGVAPRDHRVLDPLLGAAAYPACLLCRDKALVINIESAKAIITADYVLVNAADADSSRPFVAELKRRLHSYALAKQALEAAPLEPGASPGRRPSSGLGLKPGQALEPVSERRSPLAQQPSGDGDATPSEAVAAPQEAVDQPTSAASLAVSPRGGAGALVTWAVCVCVLPDETCGCDKPCPCGCPVLLAEQLHARGISAPLAPAGRHDPPRRSRLARRPSQRHRFGRLGRAPLRPHRRRSAERGRGGHALRAARAGGGAGAGEPRAWGWAGWGGLAGRRCRPAQQVILGRAGEERQTAGLPAQQARAQARY